MNKLLSPKWLIGSVRPVFVPSPAALVPLNLIAFVVPYLHSDAAMQILHWYTTLGFLLVAVGLITEIHKWACFTMIILLLSIILVTLPLNTWIAIKGMAIPNGNYFHLFMSVQFTITFVVLKTALNNNSDDVE